MEVTIEFLQANIQMTMVNVNKRFEQFSVERVLQFRNLLKCLSYYLNFKITDDGRKH